MRIIFGTPGRWLWLILLSKFAVKQAFMSMSASAQDLSLSFDEFQFRNQVDKTLESMETILENTREPVLLGEIDHTYQDKYALVEFVANSGIASYTNALKSIGFNDDIMEKSLHFVHDLSQTVTLEIDGNIYSEYVKEEEITPSMLKNIISVDVKQPKWNYYYNLHLDCTLTIKSGDEQIQLMNISELIPYVKMSHYELNAESRKRGHHQRSVKKSLNLTWLLRMISKKNVSQFTIDRYDDSCKTPSRNNDVKKLLAFHSDIYNFAYEVKNFFEFAHRTHQMYDEHATSKYNSSPQISAKDIFIPIVPVLESNSNLTTTLLTEDLDELLKLHIKTLESATTTATDKYKGSKFTTPHGIILQIISDHLASLSEQLFASIGYVEKMLETQLIEAIGKRIDANDFEKFMKQHNRKFFSVDYAPVPFSRAIHKVGRYPDGVISIEASDSDSVDSDSEPIETLVRKIPANSNKGMVIPIDAATKVELQGDQYLHGWVQHVWGQRSNRGKTHNLLARANQFSSYLLVIGVLGGSDTFIPKDALILKDKDEVIIPLLSEILPSAKEFKNKIASLSPEQQEFAKAFRSMQLESSVFGISVIPLKPQMENLLNLPEGALTKEIQLTQDLMSLFVEYQIPSDLLSFDGPEDADVKDRINAVRGHVSAVFEVIEGEKKKQLTEAKDRAKMAQSEQRTQQYSAKNAVYHDEMNVRPRMQKMSAASSFRKEGVLLSANFDDEIELQYAEAASEFIPFESAQQNTRDNTREENNVEPVQATAGTDDDFTYIPKLLDAKLDGQNEGSLKSTIIKAGEDWQRLRKDSLLLPAQRSYLNSDSKKTEKNAAMDLLKAISRSGYLPIAQSDFHVIISLSHCFQKNLLSTIIQDNINPIEQVEKSLLMVGSVIHGVSSRDLLLSEVGMKAKSSTEESDSVDVAVE